MTVPNQHTPDAPTTRRVLAGAMVAAAIALVVWARAVRVGEAWAQVGLLQLVGVDALRVQTTVEAVLDGHRVGLILTAGCSVGPLLAVFLIGAAPFVWWRDLPVHRVLLALAQLGLVLTVANQVRLALIITSMRVWGIERGYEVSHVFVGSAITTVGFVLGAVLLIRGLAGHRPTPA